MPPALGWVHLAPDLVLCRAGGRCAGAKCEFLMGKRVYLHPNRQIAALILIDRVFLLTQGRQRESIKKGFLSALGNGLTVKLYTSALLSSKKVI